MIDGQKMSKSLGNVISPSQLIDLFGVDGTRYLVARSFPTEMMLMWGLIDLKKNIMLTSLIIWN